MTSKKECFAGFTVSLICFSGIAENVQRCVMYGCSNVKENKGSRASLTTNHGCWSQICCETNWSFSGNTSNGTEICCRGWSSSLLFATRCLGLQHRILLRDGLAKQVVMRATEGSNLRCGGVAGQVEEKCCPYYRTLTVFFSHIFFHSAPEEGLYCKPKYRAILLKIV